MSQHVTYFMSCSCSSTLQIHVCLIPVASFLTSVEEVLPPAMATSCIRDPASSLIFCFFYIFILPLLTIKKTCSGCLLGKNKTHKTVLPPWQFLNGVDYYMCTTRLLGGLSYSRKSHLHLTSLALLYSFFLFFTYTQQCACVLKSSVSGIFT